MSAIIFYSLLSVVSHYILGGIGYYYSTPTGCEQPLLPVPSVIPPGSLGDLHTWYLVAIPAIGGLIAGLITYRYAPEAVGEGTDAVIRRERGQGRSDHTDRRWFRIVSCRQTETRRQWAEDDAAVRRSRWDR